MLQVGSSFSRSLYCNSSNYSSLLQTSSSLCSWYFHAFHVSFLKPLDLFRYSRKFIFPSAVVDSEDSYEVKEILDVKRSRGKHFYLIEGKGFGAEEKSLEPIENIHAPELLRKFHRLQVPKKRGHKKGCTVTLCGATHLLFACCLP